MLFRCSSLALCVERLQLGGMRFILASGSPRRREILLNMGYLYEVLSASVDEHNELNSELDTPETFVLENARLKGNAISEHAPDSLVLSADTTVAFQGVVLNKPADMSEAAEMLGRLAGNTHIVYTGFQLIHALSGFRYTEVVSSRVTFKALSAKDIDAYFQIVDPLDKAGAYGIQEGRELIIEKLEGSFSNVMGLPREALGLALENFEKQSGLRLQKHSS